MCFKTFHDLKKFMSYLSEVWSKAHWNQYEPFHKYRVLDQLLGLKK